MTKARIIVELEELKKVMAAAAKCLEDIIEFLFHHVPADVVLKEARITPKRVGFSFDYGPVFYTKKEKWKVSRITYDIDAIIGFMRTFPDISRELMGMLDCVEKIVKEKKAALKKLIDELTPILVLGEMAGDEEAR